MKKILHSKQKFLKIHKDELKQPNIEKEHALRY